MKCPQCGSEEFSPERGCHVCGHLSASPVPRTEDPPEGEMPISELNRMLSAMGVAPLSEYQAELKPETERKSEMEKEPVLAPVYEPEIETAKELETEPQVKPKPEPQLEPKPELEQEPQGEPDEAPLPMAAKEKLSPDLRKRLRALRHVSGFGRTLGSSLGIAGEWVRATTVRVEMAIRTRVRSLLTRLRPPKSMDGTSHGESPVVRAQKIPMEEGAEAPLETSAGGESDAEGLPGRQAVKRPGRFLFWVGVPLLALALVLGMLAGVLAWRKSLHEPEPTASEETAHWRYVPWTPPPEIQPEPFVIIGE